MSEIITIPTNAGATITVSWKCDNCPQSYAHFDIPPTHKFVATRSIEFEIKKHTCEKVTK